MKFSLILPVYNEEQSIEYVILESLKIKKKVLELKSIKKYEIIVVNDGSTDSTNLILKKFKNNPNIRILHHNKNLGYGQALLTGIKCSGEIIGFMDGDGTISPEMIYNLLVELIYKNLDIVLGVRLTPNTKMPLIRKIGNYFYAFLIKIASMQNIRDAATGIRVFKKNIISQLLPLPTGLHFTPVMTAKIAFNKDIKFSQIPISYLERKGTSKLNVLKDGLIFFKSIMEIIFLNKPEQFFSGAGILFLLIAFFYSFKILLVYFSLGIIYDWMIYRLITILVLIVSGNFFFLISFLIKYLSLLFFSDKNKLKLMDTYFSNKLLLLISSFIFFIAILINYRTIFQYFTTGKITVHWSYIVCGAILILTSFQYLGFAIFKKYLTLIYKEKIL